MRPSFDRFVDLCFCAKCLRDKGLSVEKGQLDVSVKNGLPRPRDLGHNPPDELVHHVVQRKRL